MRYESIFNVIGRILVGPSSSHTAGACRIGYIANILFGQIPKVANIGLHGSFAETARGHKTDVALVGGLLGYLPNDERLPFSFDHAAAAGMMYSFHTIDLGPAAHPNSVKLQLEADKQRLTLVGASVGGGNVSIREIDGLEAGFRGDVPTIIEVHKDSPGVLAKILNVIASFKINVLEMHLSRNVRKKIAMSWMEVAPAQPTSPTISAELLQALLDLPEITSVRGLNV